MFKSFAIPGIMLLMLLAVPDLCGQSLIPYRKGNLWGYSDQEGRIVIQPRYERTYFFTGDGLARIKNNGLFGYVNAEGKLVIIPRYTSATDYYLGIAEVEQNKRRFCINLDGEPDECNPPDEEESVEEEVPEPFTIEKDSTGQLMLVINSTSDTIPEKFDRIIPVAKYFFPATNYFALVSRKGLWGAYSEQGIPVAPIAFEKVDILDMKSFKARKKNQWGVNNFQGETVIPFEYDSIVKVTEMLFHDDSIQRREQFIVGKNKKFGILDDQGKLVLPVAFDEIKIPKPCNCETEYVVRQRGLYGIADANGTMILPIKYSAAEPFGGALITLVKDTTGKEGYVRRDGKEYFAD